MENSPTDTLAALDNLPVWPYPKRVLAIIGVAYFFTFFDVVNIGYALPAIASHFRVSTDTAALTIALGLVGYVIGAEIDGFVSDRLSRRLALLLSVAGFTVGSFVTALAPTFAWLVVGRFIVGMGIGAEIAAASAYITGISPSHLRGRAGGEAVTWGYAGIAVAPFVALALVPHHVDGWRWMFAIGAIGGLLVIPLRTLLPESPRWLIEHGRHGQAERVVREAVARAATSPRTRPMVPATPAPSRLSTGAAVGLFLAVWFFYYIGNYGWLTLSTTLLTKHGFTLTKSLAFVSVTGVGLFIGAAASVWLGDRFERKFSVAVALVLYAVSLLAIGLVPQASVIVLCGFVVSLTIGLVVPLLYVITSEQFSSKFRALGVANTDGWGHIGAALCPYVILPAAGISFAWGFVVMAATGVVTAILILFSRSMTNRTVE